MLSKKKPKKGTKKLINAWAFYDWANSVYSLVITTAIFPLYYAALFVENNKIFFMGYQIKKHSYDKFFDCLCVCNYFTYFTYFGWCC